LRDSGETVSEHRLAAAKMVDRNALNLRWTFGFNRDSDAGTLVDLTSDGRQAVFYSVGHTGVIFDYELRRQKLLQGHTNTITCAAASDDKKWLVTGDAGERSVNQCITKL
jgi:hypothetical protein